MKIASVMGLLLCITFITACASTYQGNYTWGHEVNSFCPCNTNTCYWVKASPEIQQQLKQFVTQHTSESYQPVYIEFSGHLLDELPEGFAQDYDGLIQIDELIQLAPTRQDECKVSIENS